MHNGFLQVEGRKMAKSEGNFVTINDLLSTSAFGGRRWSGEVLRYAMLQTHYRQPLDWTESRLFESRLMVHNLGAAVASVDPGDIRIPDKVLDPLCNDLNVPAALTEIHSLLKKTRSGGAGDDTYDAACELAGSLQLLGFERLISDRRQMAWLDAPLDEAFRSTVEKRVAARANARKTKNFAEADRIRDELAAMGIELHDTKDGTSWEVRR
jgi:cysteinyl-tRNA synthetase